MGAPYSDGLGRFLQRDDVTFKASGSEAATTTHGTVEIGDKSVINVEVNVTVTPTTLLITIEGSHDNINWYTIGRIGNNGFDVGGLATAPGNITTTGTFRGCFPATRYMRSKSSTLTGTPTYSIGGSAA